METGDWQVLDSDRELFERELDSFVPARTFDAHCHLYEKQQFRGEIPPLVARGPDRADFRTFRRCISQLIPGRTHAALCFPFPVRELDFDSANDFIAREVRQETLSRGQMLVRPEMDPEFIRETVRRQGFAGLKCYHVYARQKPTFQSVISGYLPEEQARIAGEEGLSITLHMVRSRALADPLNQQAIRHYAERYPRLRLILAHAARGFNPHHTIEGIESLRGLRNVWCDTSAVTDGGALEAIIRTLGVNRLLYGADFPISHMRGRCVAVGDSFVWLSAANTDFGADYADVRPALVGLESLRVLKLACWNLRLSDTEIEAIFFGNAAELYSLKA